jgi:hypothetical protein
LHKDGTSRKKQKILGNSITLANKKVIPLGFRYVPDETAKTITATSKEELSEVASCGSTLVSEIVRKLSFLMTDRAANEKLSNAQISSWRSEVLELTSNADERQVVHSFHCIVHVLLGFDTYATKNLMSIQKTLADNGE